MKLRMKMVLLMALALTIFSATSVIAEEETNAVSGEISASILSAYIWRGQELSRHSIVIQPSAEVSYKGFTANIWGNLDTRPYSPLNEKFSSNYTETDVTISYGRKFSIVNAEVGYIYYGLSSLTPGGEDPQDTQELYGSIGLDTLLSPTLTIYKDIDRYHQWYATLGISHTFEFHKRVSLELAAQVSYLKSEDETTYPKFDGNALPTADKYNNFHDGMVSATLPVAITDRLTVSPTLTYVFALCDDARHEMKGRGLKDSLMPTDNDSAFLYGGVVLSFSF